MDREYIDTVRLLLVVAPVIFESPRFALKGGTALNLFVQDLPRLSVDIDVVFTDYAMDRNSALTAIGDDLQTAEEKLYRMGYSAILRKTQKGDEAKLLVADQASQIKVEVNFVFRGTLLPVMRRALVSSRATCSPRRWNCPSSPFLNSMAASWSRRWIVSIRATGSMWPA